MGAYDLLKLLREDGLRSPLQVYRALDQLILDGIVHKIESLRAFVLRTHMDDGSGHAAFTICNRCGRTREFHDGELGHVLRRLAQKEGFRASAATVELTGLCETCSHG